MVSLENKLPFLFHWTCSISHDLFSWLCYHGMYLTEKNVSKSFDFVKNNENNLQEEYNDTAQKVIWIK